MPVKQRMGKILEISLPSEEHRQKIKESAKARGCTTSKYILTILEEASRPPRPASGQDFQHLQEDNRRLAADLHDAKNRIAQLDAELRKLQNAELLKPEGSGAINQELLRIIRTGPPQHDYKLLASLGIEPGGEAARGVARQLQFLEATGFISRTSRGWAWKG
jgi:hypothetical protein